MFVSKIIYIVCCLLIVLTLPMVAQERAGRAELAEGIQFYQRGQFQQAIVIFRNIILDPALEKNHGDAFFWLGKSYVVLEQLDDAERSLESFLLNYPDHAHYSEASYLKGRLLFMQDDLDDGALVNIISINDSALYPGGGTFRMSALAIIDDVVWTTNSSKDIFNKRIYNMHTI